MINLITLIIVLLGTAQTGFADSAQLSVVARVEGEANLLMLKSKELQPPNTKAIQLESSTYYMRDVKKGDRPKNGDVISTGKDGKVRLIFKNGDQVTVTPGTAYKFSWDQKSDLGPVANVIYGDIRAVIQPGGPRSGMGVRTKAAVMGVRGTDFYASAWSHLGGSKVTVLRGKVSIASISEGKGSAIEKTVEVGSSGVVKPVATDISLKDANQVGAPIEIAPSTKQELIVIQQDSKVQKTNSISEQKSEKLDNELKELEKAATKNSLVYLQANDPDAFQEIVKKHGTEKDFDVDIIQTDTVKKLFVAAPSDTLEPKKPTLEDLETGGDVYEKYKWRKN